LFPLTGRPGDAIRFGGEAGDDAEPAHMPITPGRVAPRMRLR
jgi:hypothetical protein